MLEPLEVVDFRKGQGIYTHAAFNSSYAALYYPWLEISDPITARKKYIPPCGAVAGCCARSDQKTYVWWAPAGIDRGRVFNAVSVSYKTSRMDTAGTGLVQEINATPVVQPEVHTPEALAAVRPNPFVSPPAGQQEGPDVVGLMEALLNKLDTLSERPIEVSVATNIDGRQVAEAVYKDLRERKIRNYETL
jgi:hypothetical protein